MNPEYEKEARLASHKLELQAYGLRGLEGRLERGLDPAGMLAVKETRSIIEDIAEKSGTDIAETDEVTKDLHTGAVWSRAKDLAKAEKSEVRLWMLLADECHEVNDQDLDQDQYIEDVERIRKDLKAAQENPDEVIDQAVQRTLSSAKEKFVEKDGVPFSEEDAFLHMAIAGKKYGVCKAGELYFAGSEELDYSALEAEGLTPVDREDRGRMVTFYQKEGKDVVKKLYPGLAIVFGDEKLALRLAKSAEKFIGEQK
ncbi:MAG: hypothetical protein Q8P83_00320 [bacterium]|nr:hypothetical protein [bacterium]